MEKVLWGLLVVLLIGGWLFILFGSKRGREVHQKPVGPGVVPRNSMFHKPEGADCPKGTQLVAAYFIQRDGSKRDACFNPAGDGSLDYLNPGEGAEIPVRIEPESPKGKA